MGETKKELRRPAPGVAAGLQFMWQRAPSGFFLDTPLPPVLQRSLPVFFLKAADKISDAFEA